MTTTEDYPRRHRDDSRGMWAAGFAITAAVIMIMAGVFQALEGLAAVINDNFYVRVGNYAYNVDITAWGWIHLILGIVVAVVGGFILRGDAWARAGGMIIAVLAAVANFLFIPYYPFWSILIIALYVTVIWALAVYDPKR
jgi:hypothetical protein